MFKYIRPKLDYANGRVDLFVSYYDGGPFKFWKSVPMRTDIFGNVFFRLSYTSQI